MKDSARRLVQKLQDSGFVAYFAGGCVRDQLLGLPPKDFDVVTTAMPEDLDELFHGNTKAIGREYGVTLVLFEGFAFEVTRFREDGPLMDGRRPAWVKFSTPEQDARRRDFTINGLFYDPIAEKLHDFVFGQKDLEAGILRFIGDPYQRIHEDYLRIIRALRFASSYDLQFEASTLQALHDEKAMARKVSRERLWNEFEKMLQGAEPAKALALCLEFEIFLPELPRLHKQNLQVFYERMPVDLLPEVLLAFMVSFEENPHEAIVAMNKAMPFPNRVKKALNALFSPARTLPHILEKNKGARYHAYLHEHFPETLLFHFLQFGADEVYERVMEDYEQCRELWGLHPEPLLSAHDMMKFHDIPQGPMLAKLKQELVYAQLELQVQTREEALAWLAQTVDLLERSTTHST